ncbi:MAG: sialidase family protein [Acidobacteriota bacterium]
MGLAFFAWGLMAGCATSDAPVTAPSGAGGLAAVPPLGDAPQQLAPPRVWTSPAGRTIVDGTVDELGHVLPLDIRRERVTVEGRASPAPLGAAAIERLAGAGPFAETRLGPDDGHSENETSIDADGATVVAGWNQFTDSSVVMGVGRSADGGDTWSWQTFDGHSAMSDPVVVAAGGGRWYFAYIARGGATGGDFDVFVRRSLDDGVTWQAPVAVTANATFDDKPWMHARGDEVLVAWADFSFSPAKVRAARSLDGGLTFGADTVLADNSVGGNGASAFIAPDGAYHVVWRDSFQESLWISSSTNQGTTWSADTAFASMSPLPTPMPAGYRIVNLPSLTAGADGRMVVAWNDRVFGDADIVAVHSSDGGDTWSAPVRVVDDASGRAQFFPWLDLAPNGDVHAVWYDQRHDGSSLDVYLSSSTDGGATWGPDVRVTGASFVPVLPSEPGAAAFIGDYNGIAATATRVLPFYQDARGGTQDVWVAVVPTGGIFADGFESGDTGRWSSVGR